MANLSRLVRRLALLFHRERFRGELDEEMAFHREQTERELIGDGMSADRARSEAMRRFGNPASLRERTHEAVGFRLETVLQDLRFALRLLRRSPGFTALAILILALGMGTCVAIFGFVDAALLRPLPYPDAGRLVDVNENATLWPRSPLSYPDYLDWKRINHSLSALDLYNGTGYLLTTPSGTEPVPGVRVTDGFFRTLGVRPLLGRDFLPGEDRAGSGRVVMLSYGTWVKRFGARSDIVGRVVTLSGDAYTIVGVLPRDFQFAPQGQAEFWAPLNTLTHCEQRRSCHSLWGFGRLREGVTVQAALADLESIAKQLERQYPESNRDQGASVAPFSEIVLGNVRPVLVTLLCGAALLLVIACVNVASLLLVRSESRRREVAVRGALGARPARLVRQFLTEGLLLAALGSGAGCLVAVWMMSLLTKVVPEDMASGMPFLASVGMNSHTGLFAAGVALLAAALMTVTPVLRLSFRQIRAGLSEDGRTAAGRIWNRMGANLVVVELAVAVVLLVGAGLLAQSFYRLLHVPVGFDPSHLATVDLEAPASIQMQDAKLSTLDREIVRHISALPGVQSAGIASMPPVVCNCNTDWIRIAGKPFHGEHNEVNHRNVTAGYLATLRAPLLRGRMFTEADDGHSPNVVIINQALVRKYFGNENPIGQKIGDDDLSPNSMREVVGVFGDVREGALDADIWPTLYVPIQQSQDSDFTLVVRSSGDEAALLPTLVSALHRIDPGLGVYNEYTMSQRIELTPTALLHRFSTWLVVGFAAIALALGMVGLYGVIAYSVSSRTREIGIRMAVGAQRSAIYRMVLSQAARLTGLGAGIGIVCSAASSLLIRDLLFGVKALDAPTLAGVAILLGAAAMAASFYPAHRAASLNPMNALREE